MELFDIDDDRIQWQIRIGTMHVVGILEEILPVIKTGKIIDLSSRNKTVSLFDGSHVLDQQTQDDQHDGRCHQHDSRQIVQQDITQCQFRLFSDIMRQSGIHIGIRNDADDLGQNGIQFRIALGYCHAVIHIDTDRESRQTVFLTKSRDIVVTVVTDDQTVCRFIGHSLQTDFRIRIIDLLPGRIMLEQESIIVRVAFIDGSDDLFLLGKDIRIGSSDYRIHLGIHQSRSHDRSLHLRFITAQIGREDAVHFTGF